MKNFKKCSVCKESKKINDFGIRVDRKNSFNSRCKICEIKKTKEYRIKNKENPKLRLRIVWRNIKERCLNINSESYSNYGQRGIKICDQWINSFDEFYNFCINNGWKLGLQIDRIDNNGNYCPENCRFVTPLTNSNNKNYRKINKTGKIGVYLKDNKYETCYSYNNKSYHIGRFFSIEEAVQARANFIKKIFEKEQK